MKLFLSTLFVAAMAATVQAVTVAWTLQNSYWIYAQDGHYEGTDVTNWTGVGANNAATLDVYVFFSTSDFVAEAAADAVTKGTAGAVKADYSADSSFGTSLTGSSTLQVTASNLNTAGASGYYYMVIFEGNNTSAENYAVAKTTPITGGANGVADNNQGVYNMEAGAKPDAAEYVQLDWMADSTWAAPKATPEPTALALLALGVAGLALRRKNA